MICLRRMKKVLSLRIEFFFILLILLVGMSTVSAGDFSASEIKTDTPVRSMKSPDSWENDRSYFGKDNCIRKVAPVPSTMLFPIRIFQEEISRVDGDRCNFQPTTSTYAYLSIARFGPIMGILMTVDRLIRDHPGAYREGYLYLELDGDVYLYDPPPEK